MNCTYFVSDERMLLHRCEWDDTNIEKPIRLKSILDSISGNENSLCCGDLYRSNLLEKCCLLDSKRASVEDICLVHSADYVEKIISTQNMSNREELEVFSSNYEFIFVNENTWDAASLSAGCAITLMENVLKNPGTNGFAAIRPPGHHASFDEACGVCIFNNVAICAKKARELGVERVLIVDWDVHAGQGTQYAVENDTGIRLISIHRFEHGTFWPNLPENKNTINVPLNQKGYGDSEYASIFNFLVMPVIADWQPQLILVSCGFDAALGDGAKQEVTPGMYGYMTGKLTSLGIPLCLFFEGGYWAQSIAYCARFTLNALIEKEPPKIDLHLSKPHPSLLESLFSTMYVSIPWSNIVNIWLNYVNELRRSNGMVEITAPKDEYKSKREISGPYQTRGVFKSYDKETQDAFYNQLLKILENYIIPRANKPKIRIAMNRNGLSLTGPDAMQHSVNIDVIDVSQMAAIYYYVIFCRKIILT
ncbi:histone deacetylase domain-containing protein [Ditylenchus destructor]|nr:histone deacetylase domain-containing protein [Ditylenchus destructor]